MGDVEKIINAEIVAIYTIIDDQKSKDEVTAETNDSETDDIDDDDLGEPNAQSNSNRIVASLWWPAIP